TGAGRIEFSKPLLNTNSAEHYVLEWLPNAAEPWFVELHSHFSGFSHKDGIQIRFENEDNIVTVKVSSPGYPYKDSVELFEFEENQRIRIRMEVHDGISAGARIVVWHDLVTFDERNYESQPRIFLGNHSFDSFEEGWSFRSHGKSLFWGVEFDGVRLSRAKREKALIDGF
ncbi:MAG: hypothetical protein AAF202_02655, partial [Pseudomonadota bacterium]